jgi:nucleoside-diphosphate-sugar epimerase
MATLVTGATGFLGRHLTDRLLQEGRTVRIVTRRSGDVPFDWKGRVEVVSGDLASSEVQRVAVEHISEIFNLAGEHRDPTAMRRVNVDAVKGLIEAASLAGVRQIIHASSVGVIGASRAGPVSEEEPCRPRNEYERTKLAGEQIGLEVARKTGVRLLVVRPTTVFGEGVDPSKDSLLAWLRAVQSGRFVFIGNRAIANYVYVRDVADAIVQLAAIKHPDSTIFTLGDPIPMGDFVAAIAQALGVPPPRRTLPRWAAFVVGAGLEGAHRLVGIPAPLTRQRVRALSSATMFTSAKLRSLGVTLSSGYRVGLDQTVKWHRTAGRL